MCGIAGYVTNLELNHDLVINKITSTFAYRGPDDEGFWVNQKDKLTTVLGHRRLSIIDVSNAGHQPMEFENYTIVFNGEVYNFEAIKKELQELGHQFKSNSDTEVIIHAYAQWKDLAVNKFVGMFAFAIHDKIKNILFFCRDRSGVKPLYYSLLNNTFIFSSEIKGILAFPNFSKKINIESASIFFKYGYIMQDYSIFNGIKKLLPGHSLTYHINESKIEINEYWNVLDYYNQHTLAISYKEAKEELTSILSNAVNLRMVSDVPVGLFLSGGYDSSLVGGLLKNLGYENLETYTIGFEDKQFDESIYAKKIANHLGFKSNILHCKQNDAKDILPILPNYFDEPFADVSSIPTILLSRFAAKDVKVVLSADAGDEIFAGYDNYKRAIEYAKKFSYLRQSRIAGLLLNGISELIPNKNYRNKSNFKGLASILSDLPAKESINYLKLFSEKNNNYLVNKLFKENSTPVKTHFNTLYYELKNNTNSINNMLALDYKTYMVDNILTKVDRSTMSASIEGREPLLDHRIIEFAARLPETFKYNKGIQKHILKDICYNYIPKEMLDRPKQGFTLPLYKWLTNDLKDFSLEYLSTEKCNKHMLLNTEYVAYVKKEFFKGNKAYQDLAWYIICFNNWADKWL
ncbi:MAG: asparagine synthase (glutamine-hydrolyzing) [Solirubrobacteraceae bacterium]